MSTQGRLDFAQFDAETNLAAAIHAKTGRDLFAGVTCPIERKARARIAIVMNKLQGEFAADYERVYGEKLPDAKRTTPSTKPKRS